MKRENLNMYHSYVCNQITTFISNKKKSQESPFVHRVPKCTNQCSNTTGIRGYFLSPEVLSVILESKWCKTLQGIHNKKIRLKTAFFKHRNTIPAFSLSPSFSFDSLSYCPTVASEWVDRVARRMGLGGEKQKSWRKGRKEGSNMCQKEGCVGWFQGQCL